MARSNRAGACSSCNGGRRLTRVQGEQGAKRRQIAEPNRRVLGKAPLEVVRERARPRRLAGQRQGEGGGKLDVPARRDLEGSCRAPPGRGRIPEKALPHRRCGFKHGRPFLLAALLRQVDCDA